VCALQVATPLAARRARTRIALAETRIQIDDRLVDLAPGMAVTAEIKTGQRRTIEYVPSPILRTKQESLRER
jgi:hemolysin D